MLLNSSLLTDINIENNNLGDNPIIIILKSMQKNTFLTKLNISKNRLTD